MSNNIETYKHFIPEIDIAVERYTTNVPNDGKYYIVKSGKVLESFRSLKKAEERFKQLLIESGFKPMQKQIEKINPLDDAVERFDLAKRIFWVEGPLKKYSGKGGRGGRGGV